MKKLFITLSLLMILFSSLPIVKAKSKELYFEDLTTLNFYTRSNELDFHSIKRLCTYDYCSYRQGESMKEALEIFTNNYLATIKDEEIRSILKVKGIRLTKIVLFND